MATTAADRIERTAADAERYSQGLLSANTVRTYCHIGAAEVLHALGMQLVEQHGMKRSVSVRAVLKLIGDQQTALDAKKER